MRIQRTSKAAAVMLTSIVSSQLIAAQEDGKMHLYGSLTAGFLQRSEAKIDQSKADVAAVCGIDQNCGPAKAQSYATMSNGVASNYAGFEYDISDAVKGKVEFGLGIARDKEGKAPVVSPRKYYLEGDVGAGKVIVGRQDRPFALVAKVADQVTFAGEETAGGLYDCRDVGITYHSGEAFGPAYVHVGLVNPKQDSGSKDAGKAPMPAYELAVGANVSNFKLALGVTSQSYSTPAEVVSKDAEGKEVKTAAIPKALNPMMISLAFSADVAMINAALTYTMGDPIYTSVTKNAKLADKLKDKVSGINLAVTANLSAAKVGLVYGMETANLSKDNGAVNKKGESKNVVEGANTFALKVGYNWHEVEWFGEYGKTDRQYDGQTTNSNSFVGIGATTSFKS